jgi:histidine ammonia-lyase
MTQKHSSQAVILGTTPPSIEEVVAVARGNAQIDISSEALAAMATSRAYVEQLAHQETPVYGIST